MIVHLLNVLVVVRQARPHLETFRKEQSRERAYKNYENDCISRKGMKGQGVYEQAKEYYK